MKSIIIVTLAVGWCVVMGQRRCRGGQCAARCWLSEAPECDATDIYRSVDGSCNNLNNPTWGQSFQRLERLLPPKYDDDVGKPRIKSNGRVLPSTRKVSTTVHVLATQTDIDNQLSHMHMLWGQFLDHDISHTPMTPKVECCGVPEDERSSNCIPIAIPTDDEFWAVQGRTCMELRRSIGIVPGQCRSSTQYREQANNITSYLDASSVYGSDKQKARLVRLFKKGRLKSSRNGDELPTDPTRRGEQCDIPAATDDKSCYLAGDKRVNEWMGLTAMYTLFMQEHNRIAGILYRQLEQSNPRLSKKKLDERTFQETRRIIGAILQVITYKEYLPSVLGNNIMTDLELNIGDLNVYKPGVNAGATNAFSTAAFRFGHTEISFGTQPKTRRLQNSGPFITFTETFNDPTKYRQAGQENTLRGVVAEPMHMVDEKFSQEIRDKLFSRTFDGIGLDLIAVNMQRGRDHGLVGYNEWRKFCKLQQYTSFTNMFNHKDQVARKLARVYAHVDDIDLFSGGISEKLIPGARLGPTFACLIGQQFKRLKTGDRFWFENTNSYPSPFKSWQIEQLRQVTLAKVICDNTNSVRMPTEIFKLSSPTMPCSSSTFGELSLQEWFD